jgi:hypothetical protein
VTPATQPPWLEPVVKIVTGFYTFREDAHLPWSEYYESAGADAPFYISRDAFERVGTPDGPWCIGYRHYGMDVEAGQVITKDKALELLSDDLQSIAKKLDDLLPYFHRWSYQIQAVVVSLVFDQGFDAFRGSALGREMATTWYGCKQPMRCYEEYFEKYFGEKDTHGKRLYHAHLDLFDQLREFRRAEDKAKREAKRIAKRVALKAKREKATQPHRSCLAVWRLGQRDKLRRIGVAA